jgi:hypothetical protein
LALTTDGELTYRLSFSGKAVVKKSRLGIELKDQPALTRGFAVTKVETSKASQ